VPGEPEISQIDVLLGRRALHQHVLRLNVPVNEAMPVGHVQGIRDLSEQVERPGGSQGAFLTEEAAQVPAVDVSHGHP
jgi:hypothetical protein